MSLIETVRSRLGQSPSASSDRFSRGRLRLRTLVLIRWIAVAGQTVTVLLVSFGLGFPVPLMACLAVIAVSVLSNFLLYFRMPLRARLGDRDSVLLLGFDILQLSVLLYLTGGLENPFAILIVAPVTVSATILSRGPTIVLMLLAVASISGLALFMRRCPGGRKN